MTTTLPPAIKINNLTKVYPRRMFYTPAKALDGLNLTIHQGEIFGYLGPNGAGKTTTIRLMLNLIYPTSGSCKIFGLDSQKDAVEIKAQVGNLPAELRLWEYMTGRQVLNYLAQLRPGSDLDYAYALADRLQLQLDKYVGQYSTGNKRKVGIIQAVMHRPALVIMDEPTNGLDPLMRRIFADLLMEMRGEGRTVFLSSHVLAEVQNLCDRVAVLRAGRLQAVESIRHLTQARWMSIFTRDTLDIERLTQLPTVESVAPMPNGYRVRVNGSLDGILKLIAAYQVDDIKTEEVNLEDMFTDFYREGA